MTTMFIQLRRVVCLLVLLQCCVCVAYAESASGAGRETTTSELTQVDVDQLSKTVAKAYEYIALISAFLFVLKENKGLCEEKTRRAEAVAENITAIVKEINESKIGNLQWKPKEEWIEEKKKKMQQNMEVISEVKVALAELSQLEKSYKSELEGVYVDKEELAKAGDRLSEEQSSEKPERMELAQNISKIMEMLTVLEKRINAPDGDLQPFATAALSLNNASEAVEALKRSLGEDAERVIVSKGIENKELKRIAEEKRVVATKKLKEAKAKELQRLSEGGTVEDQREGSGVEQPSGETEERRVVGENVRETQEERDRKDSKEEQANGINHTKEERDVDGVTEKNENGKEKETEESQKEKVTENTKEEKAKKPQVEVAQRIKERQEEKVEEESKKPRVDVVRAIKAIQGADGSLSPALVHGPLLLILLCVLGCTLVC
ncbi:uncharacterized protein TM35_001181040 [Trypanosoma theileri]|uniref:Uncharacterized protein n=1 Tax=Trypanosoma theileri TaxID=67003 RepID=A0A1X0NDN7_9TRYP|nr:uncharacterized protein TM35_001181040 [Trypanosoma theileri]ORC81416.1 hypothetical protein TM35_001181040 [Trypanosoma theileri]